MAEGDFVQDGLVGDRPGALEGGQVDRLREGRGEGVGAKRANELDGKTWTQYSISVWRNIRKTREEVALRHPAMFPLALVTRLIQCFTNDEQRVVFDPFVGVGTTVIAAQRLGKDGIGIEISPEYAEKARTLWARSHMFEKAGGTAVVHTADAADLLDYVGEKSVDLVVTSPPYWDILSQKRTADGKEIRDYGDTPGDLAKINGYHEFLRGLKRIFVQVHKAMRAGAYCCVVVMDIRKKDRFYPFHSDVAGFMQEIGFIYDDIIIWDRSHEYNNLRPLGYPSVFRVNKVHEFVLIFRKLSPARRSAARRGREGH